MPYSGPSDKDLPSNVKEMTYGERVQWVAIFNRVYAQNIKEDKPEKEAEQAAFSIANGVIKRQRDGEKSELEQRPGWTEV